MKIDIREKLRPYSHVPGTESPLPGTHFTVRAYPTLIQIGPIEIPIDPPIPVSEFTLQLDLERHSVFVFGKRMKFEIAANEQGFSVNGERYPAKISYLPKKPFERLSLGSHKAQDWALVARRGELEEILPPLFALGQQIPPLPPQPRTGTARLLEADRLGDFCRAALHQLLMPRLKDDQRQGLCPDEEAAGHPFYLLQEAAALIRSLFFIQKQNRLSLLPNCSFPAGRMMNISVQGLGTLDLEWVKKTLQKAQFHASADGEVFIEAGAKSFRVRLTGRDRGRKCHAHAPLAVEAGQTYYLDRFQK